MNMLKWRSFIWGMRAALLGAVLLGAVLSGAAGCKEVFEPALDRDRVVLVAPADGLVTADSLPFFAWQAPDSNIHYELQIVTPRFDSVARFVVDSSLSLHQLQIALPGGSYQWRVRAYNSSSTTPFSAPRTLTIQ